MVSVCPGEVPVLAVEGLTKRYGRKEAVSDLCFSIKQGELVGLLGPNGAGKSSTLRMIAGSLAPSSGYVRITGFDMAEEPKQAKSRIGYLPEVPPLYPEMTVREYLDFACDLKNTESKSQSEEWIQSLITDLEIQNHLPVLVRNLSKGYRQRVGIAAAIAGRPSLLLLDEPVSGLDPRQAAEFRYMLKRICGNMAVIVSSHGLYEVASLCTRIIIMNNGRIAADGQTDDLARSQEGRKTGTEASDNMILASDMARVQALEDLFISLTRSQGE